MNKKYVIENILVRKYCIVMEYFLYLVFLNLFEKKAYVGIQDKFNTLDLWKDLIYNEHAIRLDSQQFWNCGLHSGRVEVLNKCVLVFNG